MGIKMKIRIDFFCDERNYPLFRKITIVTQ